MTTNAEAVAAKLEQVPKVQLLVGTFVSRASDGMVSVDFGSGPVIVLSAGGAEPLPGQSVRCLRATETTIMLGLSVPRSGIGQVTATGTPMLTVLTSGGSVQLPFVETYSPTMGDNVLIDWDAGGVVVGKVTAVPAGAYTPPAPIVTDFTADFRATDSGSWNGSWWTNDVVNSASNTGAWFYGAQIADTIPDGATIRRVQLYAPEYFNEFPAGLAELGTHTLLSKAGAPSVSGLVEIPNGAGWKDLPVAFGDLLKTGTAYGIGTGHEGWHKYTSRAADADSGKLRIDWRV